MKRMKHPSQIYRMHSFLPMEGYLYCQEKCTCAGCLLGSIILRSMILVRALLLFLSDKPCPFCCCCCFFFVPTGALGVSWVKYYCSYKEGRQLVMVLCEQKPTTKQVLHGEKENKICDNKSQHSQPQTNLPSSAPVASLHPQTASSAVTRTNSLSCLLSLSLSLSRALHS